MKAPDKNALGGANFMQIISNIVGEKKITSLQQWSGNQCITMIHHAAQVLSDMCIFFH